MADHDTDKNHPTHRYAYDVASGKIVAGPIVRAACERHIRDLKEAPKRGFKFSFDRANHVLDFYPLVLKLNGGQFENMPFVLHPAQQFIVGSIFGWVDEDGNRRFRVAYIEMGKGNGKALAVDTPIPTPSGWRKMGDLQPGDQVLDDCGLPCNVTAATDTMLGRQCYRVRFSDGAEIVADADHLWRTHALRSERYGRVVMGRTAVRTTKEIAESLMANVIWTNIYHFNHSVAYGDEVYINNIFNRDEKFCADDKTIIACDPVDSAPVKCISVDSPSRMFLAGEHFVPTHNSPLLGGIGLYCLIADDESRAEVYSAATKKEQAMILFRDSVAMVDQSDALSERLVKSGKADKCWNLFDPDTNSFFRPISSDDGQSGPRPHCGLVDELHEHKTPVVINMMTAGQKFRRQPIVIAITNSGSDKTTPCGEYHDKAIRVCSGIEQDDRYFAYVCALDKGEDPFKDESCWIKANPLLGSLITKRYLRDQVQAATMPSKESSVRRLNFCEWTQADNPFVSFDAWTSSKQVFDLSIFQDRKDIALGLDLSQVSDLTAAVFTGRVNGKTVWWAEFWIPEDMINVKVKEDKIPYDVWKRKGWVRTTPGKTISLRHIAKDLKDMCAKFKIQIRDAPYDRWRIEDFKTALGDVDFNMLLEKLSEFGQGFKDMTPAIDAFEKSLLNDGFAHPGNPILDWCAANAVVREDPAGGRKLDKSKDRKKRIDGIVAGVMSHHSTSLVPEAPKVPSIRWM